MNVIETEDVCICYDAHKALRNVSIGIPQNLVTAFVGPSGAGKTSLLKAFNRLTDLDDTCFVDGSICVEGFGDVSRGSTDVVKLRRAVGMIFQKPNPFPVSIKKNFEMPLREYGIARSEYDRVIEKALKDVGLWEEVKDRLSERADKLSGGQQQRLCIARALALEPKVLLMDEPCSALDPLSSSVIEELIATLKSSYTFVVVTHNLAQARRIADQVVVFWDDGDGGRIIESGSADQVFTAPQNSFTQQYVSGLAG